MNDAVTEEFAAWLELNVPVPSTSQVCVSCATRVAVELTQRAYFEPNPDDPNLDEANIVLEISSRPSAHADAAHCFVCKCCVDLCIERGMLDVIERRVEMTQDAADSKAASSSAEKPTAAPSSTTQNSTPKTASTQHKQSKPAEGTHTERRGSKVPDPSTCSGFGGNGNGGAGSGQGTSRKQAPVAPPPSSSSSSSAESPALNKLHGTDLENMLDLTANNTDFSAAAINRMFDAASTSTVPPYQSSASRDSRRSDHAQPKKQHRSHPSFYVAHTQRNPFKEYHGAAPRAATRSPESRS